MSVQVRLTIALTVVGLLLFGMYGVVAYRGERADLRESMDREVRILGRSLQTALANALRDKQVADVEETLSRLEVLQHDVDVHVHDTTGSLVARSEGAIEDDQVRALAARAADRHVELIEEDPPDHPRRLIYAAPLMGDDGTLLGTLAVVRPLDDLHADLDRSGTRLLLGLGVFVILTMVVGMILGGAYIRGPLARVVDGIRHVRAGDFATRVPIARDDEIGAVVKELNTMAGELDEMGQRLAAEQEARFKVERGLLQIDKLITIGQLSAGLAHEIGSPLQVLGGRAQALVATSSDPEVKRQAGIIVAQVERITRIVEQLLSFARRRPPVIAPCRLETPVGAVLELLEGECRRRRVTIRSESDGAPHVIAGDIDQLQQIVLNLVRNALASVTDGGEVIVRLTRADDRVELAVEDDGPGIEPDARAHLFEPFFTTRAREGGTGLGLAIVRSIAIEHGAEVGVAADRARGASFTVTFPGVADA